MCDVTVFSDEQLRAAKIVREWWRPNTDERQAIFEAFCVFLFKGKGPDLIDKFAEICSTDEYRLWFPHDVNALFEEIGI